MNRRKSWMQIIGLLFVLLLASACSTPTATQPPPTMAPSPVPPTAAPVPSVSGSLIPWGEGIPTTNRHVLLCQIVGEHQEMPADCALQESAVGSDKDGNFQLNDVPPGEYYVFYDSGRSDFDDGLERWGGQTFRWDDSEWQIELFGIEADDDGWVLTLMPPGYELNDDVDFLLSYFPATLLLGDSPFIVAHDIKQAVDDHVLELIVVEVTEGLPGTVEFPVLIFGEGRSGVEIRLFQ
ncbi:MAG: hypothetical protein WBB65_08915 [Anaerolineales bacterium]